MKKLDFIIIISFIIISLFFGIIFIYSSNKKYSAIYAEISIDGILYKTIKLNSNTNEVIPVENKYGRNIIYIHDGKVKMTEADCPDKVCLKSGYIEKPGQTIVCLPHRLVIEIKGENKAETDDLSY